MIKLFGSAALSIGAASMFPSECKVPDPPIPSLSGFRPPCLNLGSGFSLPLIERSAAIGYSIIMNNVKYLPPQHIEVLDDAMAEVLRAKTGAQRLAIAGGMYSSARRMVVGYLKAQHPHWSEAQISAAAARRLSHGAI